MGGPHSATTSFSLIPGSMVPVLGESYGTSRVAGAGVWGAAGGGCTGAGCAGVRPRRSAIFASIACLILAYWSPICSHPEVAIPNTAQIHSVLRRMSSLHRVKDAGSVLAAQGRRVAALRVRHDPHHVPAGVRDAGDVVRRAVGVVAHVAPHDPSTRFEFGGGALVRHVPPVPMRDRDLEDLARRVLGGERRVGSLDPHPGGP